MKIDCNYFNSRKRFKRYIENELFDKLDLSDCEIREKGSIELSPRWVKWKKDYYPRAFIIGVEYTGPGISAGVNADINQGCAALALLDGTRSVDIVMSTMAPGFHLGTYGNTTDEYYLRFREKVDPYIPRNALTFLRYRGKFISECKAIWNKSVNTIDDLLMIYNDINLETNLIKSIIQEQTIAAVYYWWENTTERVSMYKENDGKNYFWNSSEHSLGSDTTKIAISKGAGYEIILTKHEKGELIKEVNLNDLRYTDRNFGKTMDRLSNEFRILEL